MSITERIRRRSRLATVGLVAMLTAGFLVAPAVGVSGLTGSPASAATPLPDGLAQGTAAGSCWEIKQNVPTSADGVYWLLTPALKAPQQFYCDMTTNGGGWVLIGRGREGWKPYYQGLRPQNVSTVVTGTGAFATAQLDAKTIDGILNGGRVDALADGIRIKRAANAEGTAWQEVRFKMANRDRWVWTFPAEHRVSSWSFDAFNGSGGQTNNFGSDSNTRRVDLSFPSAQGFVWGWSYGSNVRGTNSPTTYLWSNTNNLGAARPFAQAWLRPQLRLADMNFGTIPDNGTTKIEQRALANSDAERTVWGVTGLADGNPGELHTEVSAFAQVGNTVFVGGNFASVQKSATSTGADKVDQAFLAGFDVNTGQLVSSFRPILNGQVKALTALPDGRLLVGGEFTTVNSAAHPTIVALDPVSGSISPGWELSIENRVSGGVAQVRGFSIYQNWLYISGAFTHITKLGSPTASAWNAARVALDTGRPDNDWNPALNGTSVGVDASLQGDRTYFSGYFKQSGEVFQPSVAAVQTAPGAALATPSWTPTFSKPGTNYAGNIWQLDVAESGDRVWQGGSEHMLFSYSRSDFTRLSGNITKNGGDFQAIDVNRSTNTLYAGCHCDDWVYSNAFTWDGVGTAWTQADKIGLAGAWDTVSGSVLPEFSPIMKGRKGYGVWAIFTDSAGKLWLGGDFVSSIRAGFVNQWSGGFVRFAARDVVAPTTPASLTSTPIDANTARLDWAASSDLGGAVQYEVLRENKVIESTSSRSLVVAYQDSPVRYFVRAVDTAGNRSASTPVALVTKPTNQPQVLNFVPNGSNWKWRFDSAAIDPGWIQPEFNDSGWSTGLAVLGLNAPGMATNINAAAPSPRPLSAQFRYSFQVDDPSTVKDGSVSVIADDGVIVYLNGVEVGRTGLPTGPVQQNTYASAAPRSPAAAAVRSTYTVPSLLLRTGTNVISAETHANYRTTPDLSFDLAFSAVRGTPQNPAPPQAPNVSATASSPTTVDLSWSPQGPVTPTSFLIVRDGVQIASVGASTTTYNDVGLTPLTAYTYGVKAVDQYSQQSAAGTASVSTPADTNLVASGSSWKWRFDAATIDPQWINPQFDDAAWSTGNAFLGLNTAGLGTDINAAVPSPRPLSAQFRRAFTVTDPATLAGAEVSVVANDGVIVYVNGSEVGRANLPSGPITQSTYATAAPRSPAAAASRVTFTVPSGILTAGTNVVVAETHANYRSTPDLSFDLAMTAVPGTPLAALMRVPEVQSSEPAPESPEVTVADTDAGVEIDWTLTDNSDVKKVLVLRDGEEIAALDASSREFTDRGVAPTEKHTYEVRAVDSLGQQSVPEPTTS